ncbi:hypothetical protein N7530_011416 [Penicillium desertorum]|uniref:Uncharacterized protein n=1 Tax=Penicillium desertorum TaxID=1303715 RepID=A0A9X0BHI9_9EURO|nr:hypothetical protein N7530_011416 [Penicillium desertorum]
MTSKRPQEATRDRRQQETGDSKRQETARDRRQQETGDSKRQETKDRRRKTTRQQWKWKHEKEP